MCGFSHPGPSSIVSQPPSVRPPPFKPPVKRELWWWDPEERSPEWDDDIMGDDDMPRPLRREGPPPGNIFEVLVASGFGEDPLRRPAAVIMDYLVEPGSRKWSEWLSLTSLKGLRALASWAKTVWIAELWKRSYSMQPEANSAASSWEPITAPFHELGSS